MNFPLNFLFLIINFLKNENKLSASTNAILAAFVQGDGICDLLITRENYEDPVLIISIPMYTLKSPHLFQYILDNR